MLLIELLFELLFELDDDDKLERAELLECEELIELEELLDVFEAELDESDAAELDKAVDEIANIDNVLLLDELDALVDELNELLDKLNVLLDEVNALLLDDAVDVVIVELDEVPAPPPQPAMIKDPITIQNA